MSVVVTNTTSTTASDTASSEHQTYDTASTTLPSATTARANLVSAQANMLLRLSKRVRQQRTTTGTTTSTGTDNKILAESDIGGVHKLNTVMRKGHYSQYRYQHSKGMCFMRVCTVVTSYNSDVRAFLKLIPTLHFPLLYRCIPRLARRRHRPYYAHHTHCTGPQ